MIRKDGAIMTEGEIEEMVSSLRESIRVRDIELDNKDEEIRKLRSRLPWQSQLDDYEESIPV